MTEDSTEWECFTGAEAVERQALSEKDPSNPPFHKLETDEYWNDGTYIPAGWYPVTMLDVKGEPFNFANNGLRYRRRRQPFSGN